MPIKINGSTSGYTEIKAADTAANNTLTLPSASGTLMTTGGSNTFTSNQIIEVTDNTNAALRITQLGTGNALVVEDSTNPDSSPFVVDASGSVGVGTTAPIGKVDVTQSTGFSLFANHTSTDGYSGIGYYENGSNKGYQVHFGSTASGGERLETWLSSSAPLTFGTGNTERMRIDSSGNVGIGTSSPSYKVDVNSGSMRLASGSTGYALFQYGASGTSSNNWHSGSEGNGDFRWYNGTFGAGTMRMNLSSAGDLQVGAGNGAGIATVSAITSSVGYIAINHPTGTANGNWYLGFNLGGTTIGTITQATGSSVNYNTTSDYRLKDNVTPLDDASSRVLALKPIRYSFKAQPDQMLDGFLAHEAQEVVPEAVVGTKDAVDENGNPVYQGIDQSKLVPLLTAALQEALKEISDLKTRMAALEGGAA